jgi:hypothetical protein
MRSIAAVFAATFTTAVSSAGVAAAALWLPSAPAFTAAAAAAAVYKLHGGSIAAVMAAITAAAAVYKLRRGSTATVIAAAFAAAVSYAGATDALPLHPPMRLP